MRAMTTTIRGSLTAAGAVFARSRHVSLLEEHARLAIADLTGGSASDVLLGGDVSMLLDVVARAMARTWRLGDEIVLSRLDEEANIRPWIAAARAVGAQIRWAQFDLESFELPVWQFEQLIGRRTKVVALPAASAVVGTRPDVGAIAAIAHRHGAFVSVNATGLAAHAPLDLAGLGADLLSVSLTALGGPHAAAVAAGPGVLHRLDTGWPGDGPARFERSGLGPEQLSGIVAAIDHIGDLVEREPTDPAAASRRGRLEESLAAVEAYEQPLFDDFAARLRTIPGVSVMCAAGPRTPTLALQIGRLGARDAARLLDQHGVCAWHGDGHAPWLIADLGADDARSGGVITFGMMPYVSRADADRAIAAVRAIAQAASSD